MALAWSCHQTAMTVSWDYHGSVSRCRAMAHGRAMAMALAWLGHGVTIAGWKQRHLLVDWLKLSAHFETSSVVLTFSSGLPRPRGEFSVLRDTVSQMSSRSTTGMQEADMVGSWLILGYTKMVTCSLKRKSRVVELPEVCSLRMAFG